MVLVCRAVNKSYLATTRTVLIYNNTAYYVSQDKSMHVCEAPCDRYTKVRGLGALFAAACW